MTASPCGFRDGCCCLLFGLRAPPRKVERGQVTTASSSHAPPLQACFSLFHARTCYKHILCHIKVFSLEQVLWCQRGGRNEHPRQKNICWQREKWREKEERALHYSPAPCWLNHADRDENVWVHVQNQMCPVILRSRGLIYTCQVYMCADHIDVEHNRSYAYTSIKYSYLKYSSPLSAKS